MTTESAKSDAGARQDTWLPNKYWASRTVNSYLTEAASLAPDAIVAMDGKRDITIAELAAESDGFAARLQQLQVRPGQVVAFQLPNWVDALIVYHGILRAGAIAAPIIPIYRENEVREILRQTRSRVAIVPSTFRGRSYRDEYSRLMADENLCLEHVVSIDPENPGSFVRYAGAWEPVSCEPADPAVVIYTSGTTGRPRGVVHDHNGLIYESQSIAELYRLTGNDIIFMPSPVTHSTGLLYALQLPVMLRTRVVLLDIWDPERALQLIQDERCTFSVGATPFLYGLAYADRLHKYDVSSLRVFACGGADVSAELIRTAEERLNCKCMRIYGSTEVPTVTASAAEATLLKRSTTDGCAIGGAEVRIVDDNGLEVPRGTIGEVYARGPEQLVRYWGETGSPFDSEGWFHMGDYAIMDTDGYIRISGRKKDIIVRGGENISAKEVEDLLYEHPDVEDAAIVGYPDAVMGERACLFVVIRGVATLDLNEVSSFLKSKGIAVQKIPERIEMLSQMPRTASGKIQKYRLRELLQATTLDGGA